MHPVGRIVESLDLLKARFPAALRRVWDGDELVRLGQKGGGDYERPSATPEHIFDFFSGLRMVVSRERHTGLGVCLHCSMSMTEHGAKQAGSMPAVHRLITAVLQQFHINIDEAEQPAPIRNGVIHLAFRPEYAATICARHGVTDEAAQSKSG